MKICLKCSRPFQEYFENQRFCIHCNLLSKKQKEKQEVNQKSQEIEEHQEKTITSPFDSFSPFLENIQMKEKPKDEPKDEITPSIKEVIQEPIKTSLETPQSTIFNLGGESTRSVTIRIPMSLYSKFPTDKSMTDVILHSLKKYFENGK